MFVVEGRDRADAVHTNLVRSLGQRQGRLGINATYVRQQDLALKLGCDLFGCFEYLNAFLVGHHGA